MSHLTWPDVVGMGIPMVGFVLVMYALRPSAMRPRKRGGR